MLVASARFFRDIGERGIVPSHQLVHLRNKRNRVRLLRKQRLTDFNYALLNPSMGLRRARLNEILDARPIHLEYSERFPGVLEILNLECGKNLAQMRADHS